MVYRDVGIRDIGMYMVCQHPLSTFCFKSEIRDQQFIVHIRRLTMADADSGPPQISVAAKNRVLWAKVKVKIGINPFKHKVFDGFSQCYQRLSRMVQAVRSSPRISLVE
jgi:hypothetical protein